MEPDPVGERDIADRLGVKPQTVAMWKLRGLLPAPWLFVSGRPVWEWAEVERWAQATGRL